jgi:hypothetical protein
MGNCNLKSEDEGSSMSCKYFLLVWFICLTNIYSSFWSIDMFKLYFFNLELNKSLFEYKYAIGRGGFGKVWKVSSTRLKNESIT